MIDAFKDWWPFGAFVLAGIFGWALGVERNRWKINDLGNSLLRLEKRVSNLETQGSDEKAMLSGINATLAALLASSERVEGRIERLENRIDSKADK